MRRCLETLPASWKIIKQQKLIFKKMKDNYTKSEVQKKILLAFAGGITFTLITAIFIRLTYSKK